MKKLIYLVFLCPFLLRGQNIDSLGNKTSEIWKTRAERVTEKLNYIYDGSKWVQKDDSIRILNERIKLLEQQLDQSFDNYDKLVEDYSKKINEWRKKKLNFTRAIYMVLDKDKAGNIIFQYEGLNKATGIKD